MSLRVILGGMALGLIFIFKKNKSISIAHLKEKFFPLLGTSVFLGINWTVYMWAVVNGHIVETSLAYFLSPLVKVALGVVVLKESLNLKQKIAFALVSLGVATFALKGIGSLWIVIVLAFSFSWLGYWRKKFEIKAFEGLFFEHALLIIPFIIYNLLWGTPLPQVFQQANGHELIFLWFGGVVSIAPLLFFGKALYTLKLSEVALIQYFAPSMQLITGVYIYNEPFGLLKKASFVLVWLGISVYFMKFEKTSTAHDKNSA